MSRPKGFIMTEEHKAKIGLANKGKTRSLELREQWSVVKRGKPSKLKGLKTGIIPPNAWKKGHIPWQKGIKGVLVSSRKGVPQLYRRGVNANNWKGGLTKLQDSLRTSLNWRQWRSDIYTRDGFNCQDCGQHGGRLNPHHLKPFSLILVENKIKTIAQGLACDELWNINNGVTLCIDCHIKRHINLRKQSYKVL